MHHGYGSYVGKYGFLAALYAAQGYDVVGYDALGFGNSEGVRG